MLDLRYGVGFLSAVLKEQASVLWIALVAPCVTPPLAGGALLVVGTVQEQPRGQATVR